MSKITDSYYNDREMDDAVDPFDMANQRERDLWAAFTALGDVISNEDQDLFQSKSLVFECVKMRRLLQSYLNEYKA